MKQIIFTYFALCVLIYNTKCELDNDQLNFLLGVMSNRNRALDFQNLLESYGYDNITTEKEVEENKPMEGEKSKSTEETQRDKDKNSQVLFEKCGMNAKEIGYKIVDCTFKPNTCQVSLSDCKEKLKDYPDVLQYMIDKFTSFGEASADIAEAIIEEIEKKTEKKNGKKGKGKSGKKKTSKEMPELLQKCNVSVTKIAKEGVDCAIKSNHDDDDLLRNCEIDLNTIEKNINDCITDDSVKQTALNHIQNKLLDLESIFHGFANKWSSTNDKTAQ